MRMLFVFAVLLLIAGSVVAQSPPTATKPKFVYGHDLKVRPAGEANFSPSTPKVGVEFFHDPIGGAIIAISEAGSIAVAPVTAVGNTKKADWIFANELRARKSTEDTFTKDTKKYGIEGFSDTGTGKLLYVNDQKMITFADMPSNLKKEQDPTWHHALILKVRVGNNDSFAMSKKFGIEAFKDGNTGGLVYISEIGSLATATAPAAAPAIDAVKAPKAMHGMKLQVRKADEGDFTEKTRSFGVEVFNDPNSDAVVYICESGAIAVAPAPAEAKTGGPRWSHSFNLKVRKAGEKDFEKATRYGIEAFVDAKTGYTVYICETGSIAVLAKK